ncbi:MAG: hypothetical protein ACRER5_02860 [Pseudomonas sp.]
MELIHNRDAQMTQPPAPPMDVPPTAHNGLNRLTGDQLRAMPSSEMDAVVNALVTTAGDSRVLRFRIIEMEDRIAELLEHHAEVRARAESLEADRTGLTNQLNAMIVEMARDKLMAQHGNMATWLLDELLEEVQKGNAPNPEFLAQIVHRRAELAQAAAPLLKVDAPSPTPDTQQSSCVVLPFPRIKKEVDPYDPPIED